LAINALAKIGALGDAAVIIVETAKTEIMDSNDLAAGLTPIDQRNYGKALLNFLTYQMP
jgi:16S rRNA G966 N2-methylase RsmD